MNVIEDKSIKTKRVIFKNETVNYHISKISSSESRINFFVTNLLESLLNVFSSLGSLFFDRLSLELDLVVTVEYLGNFNMSVAKPRFSSNTASSSWSESIFLRLIRFSARLVGEKLVSLVTSFESLVGFWAGKFSDKVVDSSSAMGVDNFLATFWLRRLFPYSIRIRFLKAIYF